MPHTTGLPSYGLATIIHACHAHNQAWARYVRGRTQVPMKEWPADGSWPVPPDLVEGIAARTGFAEPEVRDALAMAEAMALVLLLDGYRWVRIRPDGRRMIGLEC